MSNKPWPLLALFLGALAHSPDRGTPAQEEPRTATESAAAENPLAWLAGHWVGEGFGGTVEEVWAPPRGGSMMGMFRLVVDERVVFYELFAVAREADGTWAMRLKHFNPDLSGWEEKDKSLLWPVELDGERRAVIGPVTYELQESGALHAEVTTGGATGTSVEKLRFRRLE